MLTHIDSEGTTIKQKRGVKGGGSIRQRKVRASDGSGKMIPTGTWEGKLPIGTNPNGTTKMKSVYGKSKVEVHKKMVELMCERNKGTLIEPTKMTVGDWLDTYIAEYKKPFVKPKTYINYLGYVDNHIKPILGYNKLKDLRIDMVQRFVNQLSEKKLSPETVEGAYKILRASLEQAVINGLIAKNAAYKIKLPPKSKKMITVLSIEEQERFTDMAKNTYMGNVFLLNLCTGLRLGELLGLKWSDIDFIEETLNVNRTLNIIKVDGKWCKAYGTPKTKASYRSIPLLPDALKMLKKIKSEQELEKQRLGEEYEDNNLVFCTKLGRPIDPRNMQRTFKRICEKLDLKDLHIHCLRHTFATRGLENGIELRVMQDLLGHASIRETADTYTHVLPNKKKESMEKLINAVSF